MRQLSRSKSAVKLFTPIALTLAAVISVLPSLSQAETLSHCETDRTNCHRQCDYRYAGASTSSALSWQTLVLQCNVNCETDFKACRDSVPVLAHPGAIPNKAR